MAGTGWRGATRNLFGAGHRGTEFRHGWPRNYFGEVSAAGCRASKKYDGTATKAAPPGKNEFGLSNYLCSLS